MSTQIGRNVDFYHMKSRKRIPGGKMEEKRDGYSFADEEGKRAAKKAMEWIAYKDRQKKNWKINCIVPVFRKKHLSRRWIMLCHSVILMTEDMWKII